MIPKHLIEIIAALLILSSCATTAVAIDDIGYPEPSLTGSWLYDDGKYIDRLTFNQDGSYLQDGYIFGQATISYKAAGRYGVNDNYLNIESSPRKASVKLCSTEMDTSEMTAFEAFYGKLVMKTGLRSVGLRMLKESLQENKKLQLISVTDSSLTVKYTDDLYQTQKLTYIKK